MIFIGKIIIFSLMIINVISSSQLQPVAAPKTIRTPAAVQMSKNAVMEMYQRSYGISGPLSFLNEELIFCKRHTNFHHKIANEVNIAPQEVMNEIKKYHADIRYVWFKPENDYNYDKNFFDYQKVSSDFWGVYKCDDQYIACNFKGSDMKTHCIYNKANRINYMLYKYSDYIAFKGLGFTPEPMEDESVKAKALSSLITNNCEIGFNPDKLMEDSDFLKQAMEGSLNRHKICDNWLVSQSIFDKYQLLRYSCLIKGEAEDVVRTTEILSLSNIVQKIVIKSINLAKQVPVFGNVIGAITEITSLVVDCLELIKTIADGLRNKPTDKIMRKYISLKLSGNFLVIRNTLALSCTTMNDHEERLMGNILFGVFDSMSATMKANPQSEEGKKWETMEKMFKLLSAVSGGFDAWKSNGESSEISRKVEKLP